MEVGNQPELSKEPPTKMMQIFTNIYHQSKIFIPIMMFLIGLIYFYTAKTQNVVTYIVTSIFFVLTYLLSGKNIYYKILMYIGLSIITQQYVINTSKNSKIVPIIYRVILLKVVSEIIFTIMDYYKLGKATKKLRPMITVSLIGFLIFNIFKSSDPIANLALLTGVVMIGTVIIMFEVFDMNVFTSFLTVWVLTICALAYMLFQLPIICKSIVKDEVKSKSGVSTASLLMIIPVLIFAVALYETRWYCVGKGSKGYFFEYKNMKKYLVGLILSTVAYLLVIVGLYLGNTYMNYSSDFEKNEGIIAYIKRNFKKVVTNKLNIIIGVAMFFPIFSFYFTNDYKSNKRWTMKLDD